MSQASTWPSNVSWPTPDDYAAARRAISMAVIKVETLRERLDNACPPSRAVQAEDLSGFIELADLDLWMMRNRLDLLTEIRDGWNDSCAQPISSQPRGTNAGSSPVGTRGSESRSGNPRPTTSAGSRAPESRPHL